MGNNNGLSAFPRPYSYAEDVDEVHVAQKGMSLRDYFAAKALPALIAEPSWGEGANPVFSRLGKDGKDEAEMFAKAAYRLADAMLKARAEQ